MNRLSTGGVSRAGWVGAAMLLPCVVSTAAAAGDALPLPGALDLAPADAPFVIVIDSPIATLGRVNALLMQVPSPGAQRAQLVLGQAMLALYLPGMDGTDSIAIAIMPPENDDDDPSVIAIMPVKDFAAMTAGLGLAVVDGVASIPMLPGLVVKDLPGPYAAMAMDAAALRSFVTEPGQNDKMRARLGPQGVAAVAGGGLSAIADPAALEALFGGGVGGGGLGGGGVMAAAGGLGIPGADAISRALTTMTETVLRDGAASVIAIDPTETHLALSFATHFKPDSEAGRVFAPEAAGADAGRAMAALPGQGFLLALSADTSHPPVRAMMADVLVDGGEAAREAAGPFGAAMLPAGDLAGVNGLGVLVGRSPAALGGAGLLGQTVSVTLTDDPAAEAASRRAAIDAFDGVVAGPVSFSAEREASEDTAGAVTERYAIRAEATDPDSVAGADAIAGMQRSFGRSGGPSGYLASVDGALVVTSGRSRSFLTASIGAADGAAGVDTLVGALAAGEAPMTVPSASAFWALFDADATVDLFGQFANLLFTRFPNGRPARLGMVTLSGTAGDGGARIDVGMTNEAASLLLLIPLEQFAEIGPFGP